MNTNPLSVISRRFTKRGGFYIISIVNLSLAIAVSFLLLAYVQSEFTYDQYNERSGELYILKQKHVMSGSGGYDTNQTPPALCDLIRDRYPEVVETCLLLETWGDYVESEQCDQFYESDGFYADSNVFDLFTYEFVQGNAAKALQQPESIVLSESMSQRLFPNGEAMGGIVILNKDFKLTVTGVYKDLPFNMHIRPSYLCTFSIYERTGMEGYRSSFNNQAFKTYALVNNATSLDDLNKKVANVYDDSKETSKYQPYFRLVIDENKPGSRVLIYVAASVLLLLLSALNYANSASIGFVGQIKEFGVRQIMGASRLNLVQVLLKEVFLIMPLILIVVVFLVQSFIPYFNSLICSAIIFEFALYWKLMAVLLLFLVVTLLSGTILPAFNILSHSISPALKGQFSSFMRASVMQRSLLVLQFVICVCFIVFSIVMNKQMQHVVNMDVGLKADNVVFCSPSYKGDNKEWKQLLKDNLLQNADVEHVTVAMSIPFYGNSGELIHHPNGMDQFSASRNWIDADYFNTFKIDLLEGRFFSDQSKSESDKCIITEKTAKLLGLDNPVGKWIKVNKRKRNVQIIGLVRNHEHYSIHHESPPMIYYHWGGNPEWTNKLAILLIDNTNANLTDLSEQTAALLPGLSFEYKSYADMVKLERGTHSLDQEKSLFNTFTLIALFVTLLGLFNIVYRNTQARTKEVGIRKTNGAKNIEIMVLYSADVFRWIVVAFVLACPLAFWAMHSWLQLFVYQTTLSWWVFGLAGAITLIVSLMTVGWLSWKAASQNPITALRYE